ncbi:MAG: phosphatase PAP2 family protein [Tannerellaceae bacterium]
MRTICLWIIALLATGLQMQAQENVMEIGGSRKAVRTSGDVLVFVAPVASLATVLITKDWQGLKQGALTGVATVGLTYALKYIVKKERPDGSDMHSFPSMHTSVSFAGAAFIQRRYGWKWGVPAYLLSTYVGWSRVYGKKHDWWDVAAGAAIGVGSAYIFTHPFAKKHNLSISPVAGDGNFGLYASMTF